MSQGLMIYLVSGRFITGIPGCGDDALLGEVLERMANDLTDLEVQFATHSEEYGPGITFAQALRELFQGSVSRPDGCRHVYTYAFELVCRLCGEWLSNTRFDRCNTKWLQHLDDLLAQGGVPLRFRDLIDRCPIKTTPYRDVLDLGHWTHNEAKQASVSFNRLLASVQGDLERLALEEAGKWVTAACNKPGSMVVGVFC